MSKLNFDVDIVYLWVDGNDPKWLSKKSTVTGKPFDNSEINCKGRFVNNNELMYSLRSVEKYAAWIRNIFIVTDEQQPAWLNTDNGKIKVIDHKEILPDIARPCFNASVIELFLYKIPGLSEHFLFANDDMFFNKLLTVDYFFDTSGYPIVRHKRKRLGKLNNFLKIHIGKGPGQYRRMLIDAANMVEERFGKFYAGIPHHNIDSYLKSDYKDAVEIVFVNEVKQTSPNHLRTVGDLNRAAFLLYSLAINHATLQYVNRNTSSRILPYRHDMAKYLAKHNPDLFCLNDNQRVTDEHRALIEPFLKSLFPDKSSFEK